MPSRNLMPSLTPLRFQSRNRESYLFKFSTLVITRYRTNRFQSRNRESYLFKCSASSTGAGGCTCTFQSRNRESYLFKSMGCLRLSGNRRSSFQSRNRESYLFKSIARKHPMKLRISFNLVIENLIFSSSFPQA